MGSRGLDCDSEETRIRVGEVEGLGRYVGRGEFGERGGTSRPLDRGFTTEKVSEDCEFGRGGRSTFECDEELVDGGVSDGWYSDFTTEVFRGGSGDGRGRGSAGNEEFADEGFEVGSVYVGTDDGKVGRRESVLGEGGDGRVFDGGVRGSEEGVTETVSESELMGEVESVGGGISNSLFVFSCDLRNDFLVVFVRKEFSLSNGISKCLCEVSPAIPSRQPSFALFIHREVCAYSSPFKNSAVRIRCSLERADERTPPSNSVSRTNRI